MPCSVAKKRQEVTPHSVRNLPSPDNSDSGYSGNAPVHRPLNSADDHPQEDVSVAEEVVETAQIGDTYQRHEQTSHLENMIVEEREPSDQVPSTNNDNAAMTVDKLSNSGRTLSLDLNSENCVSSETTGYHTQNGSTSSLSPPSSNYRPPVAELCDKGLNRQPSSLCKISVLESHKQHNGFATPLHAHPAGHYGKTVSSASETGFILSHECHDYGVPGKISGYRAGLDLPQQCTKSQDKDFAQMTSFHNLAYEGLMESRRDYLDLLHHEIQRVESGQTLREQLSEVTGYSCLPKENSKDDDFFTLDEFSSMISDSLAKKSSESALPQDELWETLKDIEQRSVLMHKQMKDSVTNEQHLLETIQLNADRFSRDVERLTLKNRHLKGEIEKLLVDRTFDRQNSKEMQQKLDLLSQQVSQLRDSSSSNNATYVTPSELYAQIHNLASQQTSSDGVLGSKPSSLNLEEDSVLAHLHKKLLWLETELWESRERALRLEEDQRYLSTHVLSKIHAVERDVSSLKYGTLNRQGRTPENIQQHLLESPANALQSELLLVNDQLRSLTSRNFDTSSCMPTPFPKTYARARHNSTKSDEPIYQEIPAPNNNADFGDGREQSITSDVLRNNSSTWCDSQTGKERFVEENQAQGDFGVSQRLSDKQNSMAVSSRDANYPNLPPSLHKESVLITKQTGDKNASFHITTKDNTVKVSIEVADNKRSNSQSFYNTSNSSNTSSIYEEITPLGERLNISLPDGIQNYRQPFDSSLLRRSSMIPRTGITVPPDLQDTTTNKALSLNLGDDGSSAVSQRYDVVRHAASSEMKSNACSQSKDIGTNLTVDIVNNIEYVTDYTELLDNLDNFLSEDHTSTSVSLNKQSDCDSCSSGIETSRESQIGSPAISPAESEHDTKSKAENESNAFVSPTVLSPRGDEDFLSSSESQSLATVIEKQDRFETKSPTATDMGSTTGGEDELPDDNQNCSTSCQLEKDLNLSITESNSKKSLATQMDRITNTEQQKTSLSCPVIEPTSLDQRSENGTNFPHSSSGIKNGDRCFDDISLTGHESNNYFPVANLEINEKNNFTVTLNDVNLVDAHHNNKSEKRNSGQMQSGSQSVLNVHCQQLNLATDCKDTINEVPVELRSPLDENQHESQIAINHYAPILVEEIQQQDIKHMYMVHTSKLTIEEQEDSRSENITGNDEETLIVGSEADTTIEESSQNLLIDLSENATMSSKYLHVWFPNEECTELPETAIRHSTPFSEHGDTTLDDSETVTTATTLRADDEMSSRRNSTSSQGSCDSVMSAPFHYTEADFRKWHSPVELHSSSDSPPGDYCRYGDDINVPSVEYQFKISSSDNEYPVHRAVPFNDIHNEILSDDNHLSDSPSSLPDPTGGLDFENLTARLKSEFMDQYIHGLSSEPVSPSGSLHGCDGLSVTSEKSLDIENVVEPLHCDEDVQNSVPELLCEESPASCMKSDECVDQSSVKQLDDSTASKDLAVSPMPSKTKIPWLSTNFVYPATDEEKMRVFSEIEKHALNVQSKNSSPVNDPILNPETDIEIKPVKSSRVSAVLKKFASTSSLADKLSNKDTSSSATVLSSLLTDVPNDNIPVASTKNKKSVTNNDFYSLGIDSDELVNNSAVVLDANVEDNLEMNLQAGTVKERGMKEIGELLLNAIDHTGKEIQISTEETKCISESLLIPKIVISNPDISDMALNSDGTLSTDEYDAFMSTDDDDDINEMGAFFNTAQKLLDVKFTSDSRELNTNRMLNNYINDRELNTIIEEEEDQVEWSHIDECDIQESIEQLSSYSSGDGADDDDDDDVDDDDDKSELSQLNTTILDDEHEIMMNGGRSSLNSRIAEATKKEQSKDFDFLGAVLLQYQRDKGSKSMQSNNVNHLENVNAVQISEITGQSQNATGAQEDLYNKNEVSVLIPCHVGRGLSAADDAFTRNTADNQENKDIALNCRLIHSFDSILTPVFAPDIVIDDLCALPNTVKLESLDSFSFNSWSNTDVEEEYCHSKRHTFDVSTTYMPEIELSEISSLPSEVPLDFGDNICGSIDKAFCFMSQNIELDALLSFPNEIVLDTTKLEAHFYSKVNDLEKPEESYKSCSLSSLVCFSVDNHEVNSGIPPKVDVEISQASTGVVVDCACTVCDIEDNNGFIAKLPSTLCTPESESETDILKASQKSGMSQNKISEIPSECTAVFESIVHRFGHMARNTDLTREVVKSEANCNNFIFSNLDQEQFPCTALSQVSLSELSSLQSNNTLPCKTKPRLRRTQSLDLSNVSRLSSEYSAFNSLPRSASAENSPKHKSWLTTNFSSPETKSDSLKKFAIQNGRAAKDLAKIFEKANLKEASITLNKTTDEKSVAKTNRSHHDKSFPFNEHNRKLDERKLMIRQDILKDLEQLSKVKEERRNGIASRENLTLDLSFANESVQNSNVLGQQLHPELSSGQELQAIEETFTDSLSSLSFRTSSLDRMRVPSENEDSLLHLSGSMSNDSLEMSSSLTSEIPSHCVDLGEVLLTPDSLDDAELRKPDLSNSQSSQPDVHTPVSPLLDTRVHVKSISGQSKHGAKPEFAQEESSEHLHNQHRKIDNLVERYKHAAQEKPSHVHSKKMGNQIGPSVGELISKYSSLDTDKMRRVSAIIDKYSSQK